MGRGTSCPLWHWVGIGLGCFTGDEAETTTKSSGAVGAGQTGKGLHSGDMSEPTVSGGEQAQADPCPARLRDCSLGWVAGSITAQAPSDLRFSESVDTGDGEEGLNPVSSQRGGSGAVVSTDVEGGEEGLHADIQLALHNRIDEKMDSRFRSFSQATLETAGFQRHTVG